MQIEINVRPDDPSLDGLRHAWQRAAQRHEGRHDALARAASDHYATVSAAGLPTSVREPLSVVPSVARLLTDPNWELDDNARQQFAGALAYFIDPDDLIPDTGNHFGYLDDALVMKLALAESRHEWFAWCDYSDYVAANPEDAGINRATWLQRRRERLAMDLRRRVDPGHSASSSRSPAARESQGYSPQFSAPQRFGVR